MKKQFLAKLLVLAMILAMVPVAFAADVKTANPTENKAYYSVDGDTTTRLPDEVETTIKAEVVGVTASVSLGDKAVASLAEQVKDKKLTIEIESEGATSVNVSFSAKALSEVAKETGTDLTIKTEVATIEIPNAALTSEVGAVGILKISVKSNDSGVSFSIQAGGEVKDLTGLKVSF